MSKIVSFAKGVLTGDVFGGSSAPAKKPDPVVAPVEKPEKPVVPERTVQEAGGIAYSAGSTDLLGGSTDETKRKNASRVLLG